jgi:hypothetical protein
MNLLTFIAQRTADDVRRATGVPFVIVLLSDGEMSYVGAQVPTVKVMRELLENALRSLDEGSASISDLRKS